MCSASSSDADPVGVGSNTPRDALLVQLEVLSETRRVPELARRIIQEGMELMSRRQYGELARLLKASSRKGAAGNQLYQ
jgi:RNA polymerase sigma-54 factor